MTALCDRPRVCVSSGLVRGGQLAATDTTQTLHLVVEMKANIAGRETLPDFHAYGAIAERDEQADVAIFRKELKTPDRAIDSRCFVGSSWKVVLLGSRCGVTDWGAEWALG